MLRTPPHPTRNNPLLKHRQLLLHRQILLLDALNIRKRITQDLGFLQRPGPRPKARTRRFLHAGR